MSTSDNFKKIAIPVSFVVGAGAGLGIGWIIGSKLSRRSRSVIIHELNQTGPNIVQRKQPIDHLNDIKKKVGIVEDSKVVLPRIFQNGTDSSNEYDSILNYITALEQSIRSHKKISFRPGEDIAFFNKINSLSISSEKKTELIDKYQKNICQYFTENPINYYDPTTFFMLFNISPSDAYDCIKANFRNSDEGLRFLENHKNLMYQNAFYDLLSLNIRVLKSYILKVVPKQTRHDKALRLLADSMLFVRPMTGNADLNIRPNNIINALATSIDDSKPLQSVGMLIEILKLNDSVINQKKVTKEDFFAECSKKNLNKYLSEETIEAIYNDITAKPIQFRLCTFQEYQNFDLEILPNLTLSPDQKNS